MTHITQFLEKVETERQLNINIGEKSDLIFRGQLQGHKLVPKLLRYSEKNISNLELLAITAFKRLSPPLLPIQPADDFDWIVLAQHYGLPTRLLDWTFNPLAALWFSVKMLPNKESRQNDDKASVWIFRPSLDDYKEQQNYDGSIFDIDGNMVYRPRNLTSRVVNQSSVFTIHDVSNNVPLDEDRNFRNKLHQYIVDPAHEDEMLGDLHVLNINESTIFPDLQGLCNHLKWRYFEK